MALSVDGLISGLDTTSIISQLIGLEKRPVALKELKQESLSAQKLAWQEINTKLLALETAAGKLDSLAEFSGRAATFNNDNPAAGSVLSLSAGTSTVEGVYDITVTALAQAQKSVSDQAFTSLSANANVSGTLTIGYNGGADSKDVTITSGMSLEQIKNEINSSGAPVTASTINAGTAASPQYKLIVTGDETGVDNAFTTSAVTGLSFSIPAGQSAQNAALEIDGVPIVKASNEFSDVIDGLTIKLETTGSGIITMSSDVDEVIDNIKGFIEAYNDAVELMGSHMKYDQDQDSKEALFGNATLSSIYDKVRSIMTGSVAGIDITDPDSLSTLSQIGIKSNFENKLEIDESKLRDALNDNFSGVAGIFAPGGSGTYEMISASGSTTGGDYDTQIVDTGGGVYRLQMRLSGDTTWHTLDQDGSFAYGQKDTPVEGILIRTGVLEAGDVGTTGTMNVSVGLAKVMSDTAAAITEFSSEGLIFNQYKSIEDRDKELQTQIDDLEERIAKKEEDLKLKFANLETLLARLTSQQQYLTNQLATLPKSMS